MEDLQAENAKVLKFLRQDLTQFYTGRATPMLLDRIRVEQYGHPTPLDHCSQVTVSSHNSLTVTPWDRSLLKDIHRAIQAANLNMTSQLDSECVRVTLPMRTREQDEKTYRLMCDRGEKAKQSIRQNRRVARDELSDLESEERRPFEKEIDEATSKATDQVDSLLARKKKELGL